MSILLSPALLIIDHIHFQYNGFLYGILILSIVSLRKQSTILIGAGLFAVLLCFKHIYLYLAPAYFTYLLRSYCLSQKSILRVRLGNCFRLAVVLLLVFGGALGPFWYWGQLDQLLSRLFPFSRGLCHAYWAPNIWSIYSFSDRVLLYCECGNFYADIILTIAVAPMIGFRVDMNGKDSVTRGLVGDSSFAVLPNVSPKTTFVMTILFQIVGLGLSTAQSLLTQKSYHSSSSSWYRIGKHW